MALAQFYKYHQQSGERQVSLKAAKQGSGNLFVKSKMYIWIEKLEYQLEAADKNGDKLQFVLDDRKARPTLGTAIVTPEGLLTYRPCENCYGSDVVNIAGKIWI